MWCLLDMNCISYDLVLGMCVCKSGGVSVCRSGVGVRVCWSMCVCVRVVV